MNVLKFFFNTK